VAIQGTIDESLEDAAVAVRRQAAFQGYAFADGESTPKLLVFKKDSSAYSWGSRMVVELSSVTESQTLITITRKESRALLDWGRSKRAAHKLLDGVGAKA
jgi:hypothetical protein